MGKKAIKGMEIGTLTYGCSANRADSEIMATLLAEAGFGVVLDSDEPDLLIVNTCIVKGPTEDKVMRKLKDLERSGKRVIIAGCLPAAYPKLAKKFPGFAAIGVNSLDIAEVVRDYLNGGKVELLTSSRKPKTGAKTLKHNKLISIVEISQGCLSQCSYCASRLARGKLVSYPPENILAEVEDSVTRGAKEIWMTSQDNGCYGFDRGTNLAELLGQVVEIPGDFRVRVGMMNPGYLNNFLDELVQVYENEKVFKFAHIPVQSGSDAVLKHMRRGYATKDFEAIVSEFRKNMGLTLSTDIIVGYPSETEEDFKDTLALLERVKPDFLNLSKYWPRKGTPAGEAKQLPRSLVAERSKAVADLYSNILKEKNKELVGRDFSVAFTEERNGFSVGRNSLYRPVLVKGNLVGKTCSVNITGTRKSELIGELIGND
jgi:threonylcarbamoyladenosine tRNA methylthiotransferase CDKAL1